MSMTSCITVETMKSVDLAACYTGMQMDYELMSIASSLRACGGLAGTNSRIQKLAAKLCLLQPRSPSLTAATKDVLEEHAEFQGRWWPAWICLRTCFQKFSSAPIMASPHPLTLQGCLKLNAGPALQVLGQGVLWVGQGIRCKLHHLQRAASTKSKD
eukprot:1157061-Pelagomonas_calceolata.AAC.8